MLAAGHLPRHAAAEHADFRAELLRDGMMVVQHNLPVNVREGHDIKTVPAGLTVLRIGDDGKLTFARGYDIDVGNKLMFWIGMVKLE